MTDFYRMNLLPQYIFNSLAEMKNKAIENGQAIFDFGMGNPDQPTPDHIVDALVEAAHKAENHRYSQSNGIKSLRSAICTWYKKKHDVSLDPEKEAIVTIGSKEGIAHLALAIISPGDAVLVPCPAYPIHTYAFVIAGANVEHIPLSENLDEFLAQIVKRFESGAPTPKMLVLNFPSNPTAQCAELDFFKEVVAIAKKYQSYILHDLAYSDIVFDGYTAPSILQVPGSKEIAVECYTLSKTYNMPGWRVGFMCGNERLISALAKMKSYLDYGMFAPIQVAAVTALLSDQTCVAEIRSMYQKRRDILCEGLRTAGWEFNVPKASMFVWAKIPEAFCGMGSLEFAKALLSKSNVAVSPGIGFGKNGDSHVRFGLIEDEHRTRQAVQNIIEMFASEQVVVA